MLHVRITEQQQLQHHELRYQHSAESYYSAKMPIGPNANGSPLIPSNFK